MEPKYPNVKVKLVGEDGNAYAIIEKCVLAAQNAGVPCNEWSKFCEEAISDDYDHLLRTCMKWFDVS